MPTPIPNTHRLLLKLLEEGEGNGSAVLLGGTHDRVQKAVECPWVLPLLGAEASGGYGGLNKGVEAVGQPESLHGLHPYEAWVLLLYVLKLLVC